MRVSDVLKIGRGSIVELDRLAGAPIDVLVNARLIARGEVVAIDDRFGVRVTEVVARRPRT
jgi:flagellar motor switch protein FliN/FliY